MTTKAQPSAFTFEPRPLPKQHPAEPPVKQYPLIKVNPLTLWGHLCLNRTIYGKSICNVKQILSDAKRFIPSKALSLVKDKQLRDVGVLFFCILGKKAVPESESGKEADHALGLLVKCKWNSSDQCVFESARVECLQIMHLISSSTFSDRDQSRITQQLRRPLPSRSVKHLTGSTAKMENLSTIHLECVLRFVQPRSFIKVIPKVSKLWRNASASQIAICIQKQHCKREVKLLAVLIQNLKDASPVMTADKMQKLFAMSPFHFYRYRFEYCMLAELPKVGRNHPDFFKTLKPKTASCKNVANMASIIWSVAQEHTLAKVALIQGAAGAFEKEMRAPLQSLLPKDPG